MSNLSGPPSRGQCHVCAAGAHNWAVIQLPARASPPSLRAGQSYLWFGCDLRTGMTGRPVEAGEDVLSRQIRPREAGIRPKEAGIVGGIDSAGRGASGRAVTDSGTS